MTKIKPCLVKTLIRSYLELSLQDDEHFGIACAKILSNQKD